MHLSNSVSTNRLKLTRGVSVSSKICLETFYRDTCFSHPEEVRLDSECFNITSKEKQNTDTMNRKSDIVPSWTIYTSIFLARSNTALLDLVFGHIRWSNLCSTDLVIFFIFWPQDFRFSWFSSKMADRKIKFWNGSSWCCRWKFCEL